MFSTCVFVVLSAIVSCVFVLLFFIKVSDSQGERFSFGMIFYFCSFNKQLIVRKRFVLVYGTAEYIKFRCVLLFSGTNKSTSGILLANVFIQKSFNLADSILAIDDTLQSYRLYETDTWVKTLRHCDKELFCYVIRVYNALQGRSRCHVECEYYLFSVYEMLVLVAWIKVSDCMLVRNTPSQIENPKRVQLGCIKVLFIVSECRNQYQTLVICH